MPKITPLAIYKLLPKTNCRDCGLRSCMAMAHALLAGDKRHADCPHLAEDARREIEVLLESHEPQEGFRKTIDDLRAEVAGISLREIAGPLGGVYETGRLRLRCLGRDFIVRDGGVIESICHVNVWVELMLLNYCKSRGIGAPGGRWVRYGQLPQAAPTAPYFEKRFEEPMRAMADAHTGMFMQLMEIFGGIKAEGFRADYAVIIRPLPKVPFLLLYTAAGEAGPSTFRALLESSVTGYLPKEAITYIGRGIVEMLKKILSKHDRVTDDLMFV